MKELFVKNDIDRGAWADSLGSLGVSGILGIPATKLAEYITTDSTEIEERHRIYNDYMAFPVLREKTAEICERAKNISELLFKKVKYQDVEHALFNLRSLEYYTEIVLLLDEVYGECYGELTSERLKELLLSNHETRENEDFRNICDYMNDVLKKVRSFRSFTVGINLNSRLEPSEIGILSMNDDLFVSSNFFTKFFSKSDKNGMFVTPLVKMTSNNQLLEQSLYLTLNEALLKTIDKSRLVLLGRLSEYCSDVLKCCDDFTFVLKTVNLLCEMKENGCKLCYPTVSDGRMDVKNAYDPNLIRKIPYAKIVKNDLLFSKEDSRIGILTGANSGGKSVFLRTLGIEAATFQLGMPVFASHASMPVFDNILMHISSELEETEDSRFVTECVRMKEILGQATSNTLILMDESFSGTGSLEAAAVAHEVLKTICRRGAICLFSTHIHEITAHIDDINKNGKAVFPMKVEMRNGERTYRVLYNEYDDYSHAADIARKYGLEFSE